MSAARLEETKPCVWEGSGGTFNLEDLSSAVGHYETGWVKGSIYVDASAQLLSVAGSNRIDMTHI